MEDYYTIQTPEHHSSLFTQLHSLQKQGVMCDVILAAEDGEVMAHKVILMAVSKYFREKLSPVISSTATRVFLKGIPVIELANLVKYIYTGKLLIAKETMDITLEVAEILQLNGVVNGYKEILAYEHLKVPPGEESSTTEGKPNKSSAEYAAFNVQVEQFSEEPVKERHAFGTDQAVMQNGYQQEPHIENDGAVHVASTETITTATTSALNTSTEYAFETNLFEDQYYDVTVGSTVSVQSDSQINTMPSLQKMTTTMSTDGIQSQHQDLLSVAIETLTDANYLNSPPGKDSRHAHSTLAGPYGSSISGVDTSSQLPDPLASSTFLSNPTPTAMVVNSSTPVSGKPSRHGPKAMNAAEAVNGNIPVYRVSLPSTASLRPEAPKGRPKIEESERKSRGRPRKSDEGSLPERTSKRGKLIVSPQLTNTGNRSKETVEDFSELKKCLKKKPEEPKRSDPHLNKVVEDLKSKVSETRAAKKKATETKESETASVQAEAVEKTNDEVKSAESTAAVAAISENYLEDFGQSVNFDSDDDENYENEEGDTTLSENIEKIVETLSTNMPESVTESEINMKRRGNEKKAITAAKEKVVSYMDVAKKVSSVIEQRTHLAEPVRSELNEEITEQSTEGKSTQQNSMSGIGKTAHPSDGFIEGNIETPGYKSDERNIEASNQKVSEKKIEAPISRVSEEEMDPPIIELNQRTAEISKGVINEPSEEKSETPVDKTTEGEVQTPKIQSSKTNESKTDTPKTTSIKTTEGNVGSPKVPSDQPIEEKKRPKINTNEIMTRRKQSQALKESVVIENSKTPEKTESNEDMKKDSTYDSEIFKTPRRNSENKVEEIIDEGIGSSMKDDLRSSASKRKTKAPRRLVDNEKAKTSLNKDIPIVRTRRTSKNDSNGSATDIKIHEGKAKAGNKKGKEAEKEKIDLAIPIAGKEAIKGGKHNLQPVVKLIKQSTESIMSMAKEIAALNSPKKRKLDKIQVEIEQTDASESVKKKTKRPTEPQPVSALKNRQKDDESEGEDEEDDDVDIDFASGSESEDGYIEVGIEEIEEAISKENNEKEIKRKKDDSLDGTPMPGKTNDSVIGTPKRARAEIRCSKCNKIFRYRMQVNKHVQACKVTQSAGNRDRNIFADLQDDMNDPDNLAVEKRCRSGTPESTSSVTLEIIQFSLKDGEKLQRLAASETGTGKNKLYMCQEQDCNFSNEYPATAIKHLEQHRMNQMCMECGMRLRTEALFKDHKCGLLCGTCNIVFETKTDIAKHLDEKHQVRNVEEDEEDDSKIIVVKEETNTEVKKETENECRLKAKRGRRSVEKTWPCVLCTEVCPTREELVEHENSHDLTCTCCNVKFQTARKYKFHMKTEKKRSVELICFICNKSFSRRTDQRKHMFKFHGSPAVSEDGKTNLKVFQCNICSHVAWSQRLLDLHQKAHSGVKDVPCPQCEKMFLSKYDVNRHIKVVHGSMKGRFKCGQEGCDFSTASMRTLKTHLQLKHSEEKTLIMCPFCDYKTALKGNLDKHLRQIHKLDVVSKMTLKNRQKYGEFKHGTIITKDGRMVTEDDIEKYQRPCRGSKERVKEKLKMKEAGEGRPKRKRRPKTIEEFTQEIMAKHMKRLETPIVDKDYRSSAIDNALKQPAFPQASVMVRREHLAAKGIGHPKGMILQYDKIDQDEALQYVVEEDYDDINKEVIVDDGIVPLPSTGMSVGNEVYIIEAGKSENIIESEFTQPFVENDYEDETTKSLRVLTNSAENEDETSRSLRVLTTLLEAGQHG